MEEKMNNIDEFKSVNSEKLKMGIDDTRNELIRSFILNNCVKTIVPLKSFIYEIEKEMIIKALRVAGGNQRVASFILGIKPTTLNEKIKKFNIDTNKKIRDKKDLKYLLDNINISLY